MNNDFVFNKRHWTKTYCFFSYSILKRLSIIDSNISNDSIQDLSYIASKLIDFEKELYKDYFDKPGVRKISFAEYQILCNKYIHQAKIDKKLASVRFFFCLYKDYQVPYKHFADYYKPATKAEIKQAKKDFGHVKEEFNGEILEHNHTFSDDTDVLDYRGLRLIIDDEWGDAWIKDENGEIHHFQLIWDWDYPIDEYIAYHII